MVLNYLIPTDYSDFTQDQLKEAADRLEITLRLMPPSFYLGLTDDKDTILRGILQVIADEFSEVANLYRQVLNESRIDTAYYYLDEWLKLYQLPLDFPRNSVPYRKLNRINDARRYYSAEKIKEVNRQQLILWRDIYNNKHFNSWNYIRSVEEVFRFYGYKVRIEFESPYSLTSSVNTRLHYLNTINGVRIDVYNAELFNRFLSYNVHDSNSIEDDEIALRTIAERIFSAHINITINIIDLIHNDWRLVNKRGWENNIFNVYGKGDVTAITELFVDEINDSGENRARRTLVTQGARLVVKGVYYPEGSLDNYTVINIDEYVNMGPNSTITLPVSIDISDPSLLNSDYYADPDQISYVELTEANLPLALDDYLHIKIGKTDDLDNYGYSIGRGEIIDDRCYLPAEFFTDAAVTDDQRKIELVENFNYSSQIKVQAYNRATKQYDNYFDLTLDPDNTSPVSMWSGGNTLWVLDNADRKIFAYNLINKTRDEDRDPTLSISGVPLGLGSDSRDLLWVLTDDSNDPVKSYLISSNLVRRDELLEFSVKQSRPSAVYYESTNNRLYVAYSGINYVDVYDKSGTHLSTIKLFGGTQNIYAVGMDFNSSNDLMYVVDARSLKVYVYNASDGERDLSKEFDLASGNTYPVGIAVARLSGREYVYIADRSLTLYVYAINNANVMHVNTISWQASNIVSISSLTVNGSSTTDSTILWVLDDITKNILAYNLSDGLSEPIRDSQNDININTLVNPSGISSNDTFMWVLDSDNKAYAYTLTTKFRSPGDDLEIDFDNSILRDITTDDSDKLMALDVTEHKIYAYDMADNKSREEDSDFNYLQEIGNFNSTSLNIKGGYLLTLDHDHIFVYDLDAKDNERRNRKLEDLYNLINIEGSVGLINYGGTSYLAQPDTKSIIAYSDSSAALVSISTGSIPLETANADPGAIWSDNTTMWVVDTADNKLYAYTISTKAYDSAKDITLHSDNANPTGIWSNSTTMWVADETDNKLYAYIHIAGGTYGNRDAPRDISLHSDNSAPVGIWSDGTTMWVVDALRASVYAYTSGTHDTDLSFNLDPGNTDPKGIWSDGTTMWVADNTDNKYFAYNLDDQAHDSSKDITEITIHTGYMWAKFTDDSNVWYISNSDSHVLAYSYNYVPASRSVGSDFNVSNLASISSIWTDGEYMWVLDSVARRIAAYDLDTKILAANKTIVLTRYNNNPSGIWGDITNGVIWVLDSVDNKLYAYIISNDPVTPTLELHNTNTEPRGIVLTNNGNTIWIADRKESKIFAYDGDFSYIEYDSLELIDQSNIRDIWSDGTTLWVIDNATNNMYAYTLSNGNRDESKDVPGHRASRATGGLATHSGIIWIVNIDDNKLVAYNTSSTKDRLIAQDLTLHADNNNPYGIWTNGTTMWVADNTDNKLYAYNLSTKARDGAKDFDTLAAAGNTDPKGIWSDNTTMWVADSTNNKLYAYNMSDKAHNSSNDLTLHPNNSSASDIWSNGTTMWVVDSVDAIIYAYDLSAKTYSSQINVLTGAGNKKPEGVTSSGSTIWTSDAEDNKLYAYTLGTSVSRDSDNDIKYIALVSDSTYDPVGLHYDGTKLMLLDAASNYVYFYYLGTGTGYRWQVGAQDFALTSVNADPKGIWSNGTTTWISDNTNHILYAYDSTNSYDVSNNISLAAENTTPRGIWGDGVTIWVVDGAARKLFAYDISTLSYNESQNITLDAANTKPYGIWSDGVTIWISDITGGSTPSLFAYSFASRSRSIDTDISVTYFHVNDKFINLDENNKDPVDLWSDDEYIWVSDNTESRVFSYDLTSIGTSGGRTDAEIENDYQLKAGTKPGGMVGLDSVLLVADYSEDRGLALKPVGNNILISGRLWDRYYCKISLIDENDAVLDSVLFNMGNEHSDLLKYSTVIDYEIDDSLLPMSWREMYNSGNISLKFEFYRSDLVPVTSRDVNLDIDYKANSIGIIVIPYYYNKAYNDNSRKAVLLEGPLTRITKINTSGSVNSNI